MTLLDARWLADALIEEQRYWLDHLAGDLVRVGIPRDDPAGAGAILRQARVSLAVPEPLAARARSLSAHTPERLFTMMAAAVDVCLHKYTGERDLVVGTSVHGRAAALARLNQVLCLRTAIDPLAPARHFLERVRETVSSAFRHQKLPFDRLVDLLGADTPAGRSPLFDVALAMDGVNDVEPLDALQTDIVIAVRTEAGLALEVRFDARRHDRDTVACFASHVVTCLRALTERPDDPPARISLLSDVERARLVAHPLPAASPREDGLIARIERRAVAEPDAIAVTCGDVHLSYSHVDAFADRIADLLAAHGIASGQRVAVCLEESERLVAALLAVLKVGAAYVPLDPQHPQGRSEDILRDAAPAALLTEIPLAARPETGTRLVLVESAPRRRRARTPARTSPSPDAAAYVIYTSGSTGSPKGVLVSHGALANYVSWAGDVYLGDRRAGFALCSSIAFDLTVTSVFVPLSSGGCIHVFPRRAGRWPSEAILRHGAVDAIKLTPSHLSVLTDAGATRSPVRLLIVGGESLDRRLACAALTAFPGADVYNEYGPTEATVGCMVHRFDPERDTRAQVPIGIAAPGCQVLVLAPDLEPVPVSAIGRLFVSGAQLASGYFNRPELTARAFRDNQHWPGQRMYDTGDLARILPSGLLEYTGRADHQVKVHGHRIELDEVRLRLNAHPQVRDSIVRMLQDEPGEARMVAYYVSRQPLDAADLRSWLVRFFVDDAVPRMFCHLKRLPLTLNGKVDDRALPSIAQIRAATTPAFEAPRNATEERLARIWAGVFGLARVSIHDSFFELGGHSLLAARVMSRVHQEFATDLPISRLFERPTVAALAAALDRAAADHAAPIARVQRDGRLPASFAQQRLWFAHVIDRTGAAYNVPSAALVAGPVRLALREQAIGEIVRRHEVLRSSYPAIDGEPICRIADARLRAVPLVDLAGLPQARRTRVAEQLATADAVRPFDVESGALYRARVLRLGSEQHMDLLTVSHLVTDASSMGIIARESNGLTETYAAGLPSPLHELGIQYVDFAAWQRRVLTGAAIERLVDYWRDRLKGADDTVPFAGQKPRPPVQRFLGARRSLVLGAAVSDRVRALSVAASATPFMTLLSAFAVVLHAYSGRHDVRIGTDVAGRSRVELEGVVGLFVNQVVLRIDLSGDPAFRVLIERARATCLDAYSHQDLPFDRVVDALRPRRDAGAHPLFQVMFSMDNTAEAAADSPPFVQAVAREKGTSVFDLSLYMTDRGGSFAGALRYNPDLFGDEWAEDFLDDCHATIERASANADVLLSVLTSLLLERQRGRRAARESVQQAAARARLTSARRRSASRGGKDETVNT